MKIVAINGSPRKGNTLAAIRAFAEGAKEKHEIGIINAGELNIGPCTGCDCCMCMNGCVAKDDTNRVIDRIAEADMIVFGSPVYWWGVTAQLKTVIDKMYCRGALIKGKKIGIILCGGASAEDEEYDLIRRQFECMAEYLKWEIVFVRKYCANEREDLASDMGAISELVKLGKELPCEKDAGDRQEDTTVKEMNRGTWLEMLTLLDKMKAIAKKEAEEEDYQKICGHLSEIRAILDEYSPRGLS